MRYISLIWLGLYIHMILNIGNGGKYNNAMFYLEMIEMLNNL